MLKILQNNQKQKRMKKVILSIFLCSIIFTVNSQSCLPDGITFSIQAEIDSFQDNYPNCTEIEGDVIISGNNIESINGLSVLTSIQGKLKIEFNDSLSSLTGLENLTSVGSHLVIEYNNLLTSLSGLSALSYIGGDLEFRRNEKLINTEGLNSLETIENTFTVYKNDNLINLQGLESLTTIGKTLYVYYNSSIENLNGLNNVTFAKALFVYQNPRLKNLSGLNSLSSTQGDIQIYSNDSINNISDLNNVLSLNGELWIYENPKLTSLEGLDNIDANTISNLVITNNQQLSECEVKSICDLIAINETSDFPLNNADGCNSTNEIKAACDALSINDSQNPELMDIYPNPTNQEFIEVKTTNKIERIRLYNQFGQNVVNHLGPNNRIEISSLKQGLYVIKVEIDSKTYSKKIIIE